MNAAELRAKYPILTGIVDRETLTEGMGQHYCWNEAVEEAIRIYRDYAAATVPERFVSDTDLRALARMMADEFNGHAPTDLHHALRCSIHPGNWLPCPDCMNAPK